MFPSDLFPQLVNFAEQLFLVSGQGFGYVYFAFGSDTKIGEVTSFLVNKQASFGSYGSYSSYPFS